MLLLILILLATVVVGFDRVRLVIRRIRYRVIVFAMIRSSLITIITSHRLGLQSRWRYAQRSAQISPHLHAIMRVLLILSDAEPFLDFFFAGEKAMGAKIGKFGSLFAFGFFFYRGWCLQKT